MARIKTGAISISWGSVIPGREPKALEVFGKIMLFAEELQKSGQIDQVLMFVPIAGSPRDTLLLLGDTEKLPGLLVDDNFDSHLQEGMLVVEDLRISLWGGGSPDSLSEGLTEYLERLQSHGLV